MSEPQNGTYKVEHSQVVKDQIRAIAKAAKQSGKLKQFIDILELAVHRLRTDPHGWGDPEYRVASANALVCHGLLRPVVFDYVIYEGSRAVVLIKVRLFAEFA